MISQKIRTKTELDIFMEQQRIRLEQKCPDCWKRLQLVKPMLEKHLKLGKGIKLKQ